MNQQYVNMVELPLTLQDLDDLVFMAYRPCPCCGGIGRHATEVLDLGLIQIVVASRPCDICFDGLYFVNHVN